ncbi:MAG: DNA/RNA nuclease SfsA [Lachnospiraceae bacterium]|nr:DNA/RNA nuclease SfsA [Lachnospiraceae bacterium]
MFYSNTLIGTFLSRPNRFLAHVMVGGEEKVCHVKNTGRLRELLLPGAQVILQHHPDAAVTGRKTEYSLIGVSKPLAGDRFSENLTPNSGDRFTWVNIDSQAPNQAAYEWLTEGEGLPFCPRPQNIRREVRWGQSRFDLAFMDGDRPWFMEVKGVTLDMDGTATFPDAPTERGIKHLDELSAAVKEGYGAAALFVIQMKGISAFAPHRERHPEFADALVRAKQNGVHVWAYDCVVTENSMKIDAPVTVRL